MSGSELAVRAGQEVQKRTDALLCGLGFELARGEIGRAQSDEHREKPHVRRGAFFFTSENVPEILRTLRTRVPLQCEAIISSAEKILLHRFDLLGYENVDYGPTIDWKLDEVHSKRAPNDLWYAIPYLDFGVVGDAKITWELNRHQHLVTLAKAYRLTEDFRFAAELISQWRDWNKHNCYPRGINWASTLEVGFRSLSWLLVYFLLQGTAAVSAKFQEEWLRGMAVHGRHIESYPSTYFSPNTHLVGEGLALFFIGTLCPELRSAGRWKRQGWEMVLRESERQIREDGFYFEQSTYYHVYALDMFLHAKILGSLNDAVFPKQFDDRVVKMLETLAVLCRAGEPSLLGDDDGGRLFDPRRNQAVHLFDPLATGAVLFGRRDFKCLAGELREETIWLLGQKGVEEFDRIEAEAPNMNSVRLVESGLNVMSTAERKLQSVIDAGPQGALRGGHAHADALSMNVHADGFELLGDPGTGEYVGANGARDKFRGTAAHNTMQLDGLDQVEPRGPFAWERLVKITSESGISGVHFDWFVGSHDGYGRAENPAVHRRWVFFRKPRFWVVRDRVFGSGTHQLDLRWHLHPRLSRSESPSEGFVAADSEGPGVAIFSAASKQWVKTTETTLWSKVYGHSEQATTLRFSSVAALPSEIVTLILPLDTQQNFKEATFTNVDSGSKVAAYRFAENETEHYFIFGEDKEWTFEDWKSDARFFYYSQRRGRLELILFCDGTGLNFRDHRIMHAKKPVERFELIYAQGIWREACSEKDILFSQEEAKKVLRSDTQRNESDR